MTEPRTAAAEPTLPAPGSVPVRDQAPVDIAVRIKSADLFGGALELQIDHHGAVYRLKQTSLGKLILTK